MISGLIFFVISFTWLFYVFKVYGQTKTLGFSTKWSYLNGSEKKFKTVKFWVAVVAVGTGLMVNRFYKLGKWAFKKIKKKLN